MYLINYHDYQVLSIAKGMLILYHGYNYTVIVETSEIKFVTGDKKRNGGNRNRVADIKSLKLDDTNEYGTRPILARRCCDQTIEIQSTSYPYKLKSSCSPLCPLV